MNLGEGEGEAAYPSKRRTRMWKSFTVSKELTHCPLKGEDPATPLQDDAFNRGRDTVDRKY